jgi:hypothetical protein
MGRDRGRAGGRKLGVRDERASDRFGMVEPCYNMCKWDWTEKPRWKKLLHISPHGWSLIVRSSNDKTLHAHTTIVGNALFMHEINSPR